MIIKSDLELPMNCSALIFGVKLMWKGIIQKSGNRRNVKSSECIAPPGHGLFSVVHAVFAIKMHRPLGIPDEAYNSKIQPNKVRLFLNNEIDIREPI